MNLNPPLSELWRRIELADDAACYGIGYGDDPDCVWCKLVIEHLRGGLMHCPDCDHINAIGHSCTDWREYDAGEIDNTEVGRRWKERDAARFSGTSNPAEFSVRMVQP